MRKQNILKELNRLLDDYLLEGKSLKNFNASLYDIRELERVRTELKTKGYAETINANVNKICLYCGIKTQIKGIGYKIMKEPSFL